MPIGDPDDPEDDAVVSLQLGPLGGHLVQKLRADLPLPEDEEGDAVLVEGAVHRLAVDPGARPPLTAEVGDHVREPVDVDEERVVPVGGVHHRQLGAGDEPGHLALLRRPVEDVRVDRDDQHRLADRTEHLLEVPAPPGDVVGVHRLGEDDVGGGVEALHEGLPLVAKVALHREELLGLLPPGEALLEARHAPVGAHRHHARGGEPGVGRIGRVVASGAPARIGEDRLALGLREADRPGRVARGARHEDDGSDQLRVEQGPFQDLHPAERAADDHGDVADAERGHQGVLDTHHVPDGDRREGAAVRAARGRIDRGRAGRPVAAPQDVRAENEVAFGVEGTPRPEHARPPRVDVRRAGQRVADDHCVPAVGREPPPRPVADAHLIDPPPELEVEGTGQVPVPGLGGVERRAEGAPVRLVGAVRLLGHARDWGLYRPYKRGVKKRPRARATVYCVDARTGVHARLARRTR
jgi:hypothetical protein